MKIPAKTSIATAYTASVVSSETSEATTREFAFYFSDSDGFDSRSAQELLVVANTFSPQYQHRGIRSGAHTAVLNDALRGIRPAEGYNFSPARPVCFIWIP